MVDLTKIEHSGKIAAVITELYAKLGSTSSFVDNMKKDDFKRFAELMPKVEESLNDAKILYDELLKLREKMEKADA